MINYEDVSKIELKVAKVLEAERVEGSEKLLKLQINVGDVPSTDSISSLQVSSGQGKRQIVAGIGKSYSPEELVGKEIIIVANLEPRAFTLQHGSEQVVLESNGMLLAAKGENGSVLLTVDKEVPPGAIIG